MRQGRNALFYPLDCPKMLSFFIIKTNLTKPYTSVFLHLKCGCWTDADENALRAAMQKKQPAKGVYRKGARRLSLNLGGAAFSILIFLRAFWEIVQSRTCAQLASRSANYCSCMTKPSRQFESQIAKQQPIQFTRPAIR